MRSFALRALLAAFTLMGSIVKAQTAMNLHEDYGIRFWTLSANERDSILSTIGHVDYHSKDVQWHDERALLLDDGRLLFDMTGIQVFLFKSAPEFDIFLRESSQRALKSTVVHVADTSFLEKVEMYEALLTSKFDLSTEPYSEKWLTEVEGKLVAMGLDEIRPYRLSIIALLGNYVVRNNPGTEWSWLNVPQQGATPVVLSNGKLFSPAAIYGSWLNGEPIKLFNQVRP